MATVRDLIKGSLRAIGAIASGETPSSAELSDSLSIFNDMLDSWSTEKLLIPAKVREEFAFTGGVGSYTMGPSADFDTSRPLDIENAAIEIQDGSSLEIPLRVINSSEWAAIAQKELQSDFPTTVYAEFTASSITLRFWPVPRVANKAVLYTWKPLTAFANVSADLELPPGYSRALRLNLAIELAPEFGREPSQALIDRATTALANIKRNNIKPIYLKADEATRGNSNRFNILRGY